MKVNFSWDSVISFVETLNTIFDLLFSEEFPSLPPQFVELML